MNTRFAYEWAKKIGKEIIGKSETNGRKYVEYIIKEIEKEELVGRFFEELEKALFKISEKLSKESKEKVKLSIDERLVRDYYGDNFYKIKAAILAGFINSLAENS